MSNSDAAGNESSSSNPILPPTHESPRGGELAPRRSPHGRGSSPMHSWEMALFSPPPPRAPPIIGAPGRTAFGPYRPPAPQWRSMGPSHGPSGSRGLGFQAVPVGGGGGGVAAAVGLRIGGSPSGRKRGREGGVGSSGGGNRVGEGGVQHCSVCNKGFGSSKALFGHMRSHPDRGWKGVHPPPAFRAEEEFADLHVAPEAEAAPEAGEDEYNYRVPDLNHPPPPDSI